MTDSKPASSPNDWSRIQGRLKQLYNGPDPMFTSASLCVNCGFVAIDAGDCRKCHKLICGPCQDNPKQSTCKNCHEPCKTVDKLHPVEQAMFDRATFACCYDACKQKSIAYKDYSTHIFKECKFRIVECPNGCGCPPFEVLQEATHRKTCSKEQVTCAACKKVKVARSALKAHLENECTNSNLVCTKCHGNYKASEEHCCITHLRTLIEGQAASSAEDRSQTNDIFENFNNHVTQSLQHLQDRCNEQQDDTQKMLEAILGLNTQVASFQSNKLEEMAQLAAMKLQKHQQALLPEAGFKMALTTPMTGPKTACRLIEAQGAQTGKYFSYPEVQKVSKEEIYCPADFKAKILTKISACVGVGIYSLRLQFDDGTMSPIIGSRTELATEVALGTEQINNLGIRAWKENYVQTLVISQSGKKGQQTLESQSNNGTMAEFKLAAGEKVVGVHGYLDPNGDLRGFGFIIVKS